MADLKVFDRIRVKKTCQTGKIVILIGLPPRELYADMTPGADSGYEYFIMWNEETQEIGLRALNRYKIDEIEQIHSGQD